MSTARRFAGNAVAQMTGKIISTLLGLLTVGIMTRYLGRAGYGEFTTILSFLQFVGILVDFGLTLTMIKLVSEVGADERRITSNIFTMRLVTGLVFFGLAPFIVLFFPYSSAIKSGVAVASLSFLAMSLSQVLLGLFQHRLAVHLATLAEVVGRLLLLVGTIAAAFWNGGLFGIIIALAAGNIMQLLLVMRFARAFVPLSLEFHKPTWKRIFTESWPIGISIAFNLIYLKGDILLLSLSRSQDEVGLYGAAYKILDVITVMPTIFMGLALPLLTAAWSAGQHSDFLRRLWRSFDVLSMLAIPLAIGTFAVSNDFMALIGGAQFADSGRLLSVLMLAGTTVFWGALFGHTIVALGLQRRMIWAYAIDAALSLCFYIIFIPRYGAIAAAWVTFFSEALIAIITAVAVIRTVGSWPKFGIMFRAIIASGVMYGALLATDALHVLLRIGLGIASYFICMLLIGGIDKDIVGLLRRKTA
jgi:O-antigen/teichoic acid export membrane protein